MVEGPMRLGGVPYREGERPEGPECREQVRVVRSVEKEVRRDRRDDAPRRGRAFLAVVIVTALVAGALVVNLALREAPNSRPSAALRADRALTFTGEPVTFDGSDSDDPDGSLVLCEWRFEPGGLCETRRPVIIRSFDRPGAVNVSLRVQDDRGGLSNHSRARVIVISIPNASAREALTLVPIEFAVDDGGAGLPPESYRWNFSDGSPPAEGRSVVHAFGDDGNFSVRFEASFGGQTIRHTSRVNITNRPPVAYYNLTEPGPYYTNHPWTFDGSRTLDPDGSLARWFWDFGDGTTDEINGSVVVHSFPRSGAFRVTLRVTDDDEAGSFICRDIVVMKDLLVIMVDVQTYVDQKGAARANVTVRFDNPGDPKTAGAVRVSVTAHTPAKNNIDDPESSFGEFYGEDIEGGESGLSLTVNGLLISAYLPEKTWYLVELGYLSTVVDSRWYQKD